MRRLRFGAALYGAAVAVALAIGVGLVMGAAPRAGTQPTPQGLQALPWAFQPAGSPTIDDVAAEDSIEFPPGVSYAEALQELYVSVSEGNRLPAGAVVRPALPREVAVVSPDAASKGVRISLTAPFGWASDTRQIRPPSISLSGDLSPEEVSKALADAAASGSALPAGATVDIPSLDSCQEALGAPDRRPACR